MMSHSINNQYQYYSNPDKMSYFFPEVNGPLCLLSYRLYDAKNDKNHVYQLSKAVRITPKGVATKIFHITTVYINQRNIDLQHKHIQKLVN